jgi:hypothetical protein
MGNARLILNGKDWGFVLENNQRLKDNQFVLTCQTAYKSTIQLAHKQAIEQRNEKFEMINVEVELDKPTALAEMKKIEVKKGAEDEKDKKVRMLMKQLDAKTIECKNKDTIHS